MRNLIIIILTIAIVIAGAFLPELLMDKSKLPELSADYQQVTVTSDSSSDYAWRMEQIAEHYYGEGENLLTTYISGETTGEEGSEARSQFLTELASLVDAGILPEYAYALTLEREECSIRYYYIFDSDAVSGFRIAEFSAGGGNWSVNACMDAESGKLAVIEYGGRQLVEGKNSYPQGFTSWYDMLHSYADYLGLSLSAIPEQTDNGDSAARQYYNACTADKWTGKMPSGTGWMELRVLRENNKMSIAVYDGGK